jgi:hypothetical protein
MRRSLLRSKVDRAGKANPLILSGREEYRESMRFMISVRFPTDKGNALIKDGKLPQTIQSIMEDLKPEAAYFADMDGARGGYFIVNMDEASDIAAVAEPLLIGLDATIKVQLVMTPEDLQKATPAIEQAAQKYG